jgi:inner membrane protein
MKIERVAAITTTVTNLFFDDEKIAALPQERTYLRGTLTIFDTDGLIIPSHIDRYDTITLQPGSDITYVRLIAASPQEVVKLLGDYYASGNLVVRIVGSHY